MYFNFYAVQVKRLQKMVPEITISYLGKDMNCVFLSVNGKDMAIERERLRRMANLSEIASSIKNN